MKIERHFPEPESFFLSFVVLTALGQTCSVNLFFFSVSLVCSKLLFRLEGVRGSEPPSYCPDVAFILACCALGPSLVKLSTPELLAFK
jgi:hypothetical protein